MKHPTVIEECQRLGAIIIDMSKFDHMKSDVPTVKEEKVSVQGCPKCGGQIMYSDFSYKFRCINGCEVGPK